jgi:hypothetical protein
MLLQLRALLLLCLLPIAGFAQGGETNADPIPDDPNAGDFGQTAQEYVNSAGEYPTVVQTSCGHWTLTVTKSPSNKTQNGTCSAGGSAKVTASSLGDSFDTSGSANKCGGGAGLTDVDGYRKVSGKFTPNPCCIGYVEGAFSNEVSGKATIASGAASGSGLGMCVISTDFTTPASAIATLKKSSGSSQIAGQVTITVSGKLFGIPYSYSQTTSVHTAPNQPFSDGDQNGCGGAQQTNDFFVHKFTRACNEVFANGTGSVKTSSNGSNKTIRLFLGHRSSC